MKRDAWTTAGAMARAIELVGHKKIAHQLGLATPTNVYRWATEDANPPSLDQMIAVDRLCVAEHGEAPFTNWMTHVVLWDASQDRACIKGLTVRMGAAVGDLQREVLQAIDDDRVTVLEAADISKAGEAAKRKIDRVVAEARQRAGLNGLKIVV